MRTGQAIMSEITVQATQLTNNIADLPWKFNPSDDDIRTLKACHAILSAYFRQIKADK